jgi:hypothetical protein
MSTFNPGDFINALHQLSLTDTLYTQLKNMVDTKSASLRIGSQGEGVERKIRFYSKEFNDALEELNKNAIDSLDLQSLIDLMVGQIQKEQVIFKEKVDGKAIYHASKNIMDRIRSGEFTLKTKSGEKLLAIAGENPPQDSSGQVRALNIQEFATGSVSSIAEQMKQTLLQALTALNEQASSTQKKKAKTTEEKRPPVEQKTQIVAEKPAKEHEQEEAQKLSATAEKEEEKENQKEVTEKSKSDVFYENEKEKDEAWKEKHDMVVEKEELKQEIKKEAAEEDVPL